MSHPRIEEVEDSDLEASDPSEADIDDFDDADIMRRVVAPPSSSPPDLPPASHLIDPANIPSHARFPVDSAPRQADDDANFSHFQCLYPIYFDGSRSRQEGRRVSSALAVRNPLAVEIANACTALRLRTVLDISKTHPRDWANPGRARVDLAAALRDGSAAVKNKHHLLRLVAAHLRAHPTTEGCPALRMRIQGAPPPPGPAEPWPRPAVPRGWKMGELLPFVSPALTGGGVSENLFKDMMKEMQGGGMDSMAALMGAAGGSDEGAKKKKGKAKK